MKNLKYFFTLTLVSLALSSFSQKQGDIWYFGNKAGLDFRNGTPQTLLDSELNTFEGSTVLADTNGNLLLYSDGSKVYNKNHQTMQNGTGLKGENSSSQSACIVPYPGNNDLVYLFTIGVARSDIGLHFSIIDLKGNGGLGVVTSTKNVKLFTDAHEKMTAMKHPEKNEYWVLIQKSNTNEFLAYNISDTGVARQPVISTLGPVSGGWYSIKASSQGDKVATTHGSNGSVSVMDFNPNTGVLSNVIVLPMEGSENYGVEFSPNGKVLYATNYVSPIVLYQWDLNAGNESAIINSRITLATYTGTNDMGQIQLASNGKLYVARRYKTYIDCIENPDVIGTGCNYVTPGPSLGTRTCGLGLPTIMINYMRKSSEDDNNAGVLVLNQENIKVYPIPSSDFLHVEISTSFSYVIYDNIGRELLAGSENNKSINIQALPVGIFNLKLITEEGKQYMIKFIKN